MDKVKNVIKSVKDWIKSNGVTGILGLILGIVLWIMGYKIIAGFSLGVFFTRNYDLIVNSIKSYINGDGKKETKSKKSKK